MGIRTFVGEQSALGRIEDEAVEEGVVLVEIAEQRFGLVEQGDAALAAYVGGGHRLDLPRQEELAVLHLVALLRAQVADPRTQARVRAAAPADHGTGALLDPCNAPGPVSF